jgi:cyanate permease
MGFTRYTYASSEDDWNTDDAVRSLIGGSRQSPSTLMLHATTAAAKVPMTTNWLPTVLNDLGVSFSVAAAIGAMLQVGGVIGTVTLGQFIDRFSFRALALVYFCAALAVATIGLTGHSTITIEILRLAFALLADRSGQRH